MPKFLHLGPARCATTWQARVYSEHPDVYIPCSKDTEFFSHQYARGETWYRQQYKKARPDQLMGEICHRYFWHPEAPSRAKKFNPEFKLIITLRDPWERLISSYLYDRTLYLPHSVSLSEYLELPVVKATIRYTENIQRWRDHFPESQILIRFYEDLHADPRQWLQPIWNYLGVKEYWREDWMERTWKGRTVRNETFAHFAFSVSQLLRRFGHYQVVGCLKQNSWIERSLYSCGKEEFLIAQDDLERAKQIIGQVYTNWEKVNGHLPHGWKKP